MTDEPESLVLILLKETQEIAPKLDQAMLELALRLAALQITAWQMAREPF